MEPTSSAIPDALGGLARRIGDHYAKQTAPRAVLLTGSLAEGVSDAFSDIDLIAYYDTLPTDDELADTLRHLDADDVRASDQRDRGMVVREFRIGGVECQIGHVTVASWEETMRTVLTQHNPGTLAEKAIGGLLEGVALHGEDLMVRWQHIASHYPDELAHATVSHYLKSFPLWMTVERLDRRDATIFFSQMLVEASLNLLGVLAGLNHLYFSPFQFKRLHRFASRMRLAPDRLADRLDDLFSLDRSAASVALERLVEETVSLVEAHMPAIDTAPVRGLIGVRQRPWDPAAER